MNKASMILLGIGILGGGTALLYSLREARAAKNGGGSRSQSLLSLANAACASDERGDRDGFLLSVQAMGTLLDPNAAPSLQYESDMDLLVQYQIVTTDPSQLDLCDTVHLAHILADRQHDYEAGQVLRIALSEGA